MAFRLSHWNRKAPKRATPADRAARIAGLEQSTRAKLLETLTAEARLRVHALSEFQDQDFVDLPKVGPKIDEN